MALSQKIKDALISHGDSELLQKVLVADVMGEKDKVHKLLSDSGLVGVRGRSYNPGMSVCNMTKRYLATRAKCEVEAITKEQVIETLNQALVFIS